jgi:sulfatase modifying factor 1
MGSNPSFFKEGRNFPVEQVSWNDVQQFMERLNGQSGRNYRLPSEAEWEYAARSGGKKQKYAGTSRNSELDQYAWFYNSGWYQTVSKGKTHAVGQKKPNGLGLFDMSGNVLEWCSDWYDENYYRDSPKTNPRGPYVGSQRVLRGGSWIDPPSDVRAAGRIKLEPSMGSKYMGFRLLLPSNSF